MSERERVLEVLKNTGKPIHTANIWFELSFNIENPPGDKITMTQTLLQLEREGHVKRHDIDCLNYWTYRTPNILHKLMNYLRGKQ